jgi:hypothetical protein
MREPNKQGPVLSQGGASRAADPASAPPAKPSSRWDFLSCLATWMPGGTGCMTATGAHIWMHPRHDHD